MKHIITLVAVAFTLSLGACCSTGSCPMGGKKECSTAGSCCKANPKTCTKEGGCKHKH